MATHFICLANSKKYNERCIAGIVVKADDEGNFSVVNDKGKPKWIRPITNETNGQVPSALVSHIDLLNIVEIRILKKAPDKYQSENVLFDEKSLKVVGKYKSTSKKMDLLIDNAQNNLFGNRGKAVHQDDIGGVLSSLTLIKVNNPVLFRNSRQQLRIDFDFKGISYDLPITDVKFINYCKTLTDSRLKKELTGDIFLAISLAVPLGEFYYKLVAGVIR